MKRRDFIKTTLFALVAAYAPINLPEKRRVVKEDFIPPSTTAHSIIPRTTIGHGDFTRIPFGYVPIFRISREEVELSRGQT